MKNCKIDFKELQKNINTFELLVADLYYMKENLESRKEKTREEEGMLLAIDRLLIRIE